MRVCPGSQHVCELVTSSRAHTLLAGVLPVDSHERWHQLFDPVSVEAVLGPSAMSAGAGVSGVVGESAEMRRDS